MSKKRKKKNKKSQKVRTPKKNKERTESKEKPFKYPILTSRLRRRIGAILMMLSAAVISFSFFNKAGAGGKFIFKSFDFLIGKTVFFIPFLLFFGGFLILKPPKKRIFAPIFYGLLVLVIGISGILSLGVEKNGGWLGFIVSWPFFNYLGGTVSIIIFSTLILIGGLIFWEFLPKKKILPKKVVEEKEKEKEEKGRPAFAPEGATVGKPKFEIKSIGLPPKRKELPSKETATETLTPQEPQVSQIAQEINGKYNIPPINLLDISEEKPLSNGDIEYNAVVIKKTLQNFGIEVEMSEINIGPTVTQYTLRPSEGVKLSKITTLNNDLALVLAAHPIRIEAPIPGRSLVGIEVPNKVRAKVKIGNLLASPKFQKLSSPLSFALGRDVMGNIVFPDLEKMPHLLVAGSTGSGKTICLNSLILSLVYQNSPKILKLILIDPKRVEFPVYKTLPHLLTPVIFNSQKAVNALNWLMGEMERRFEILREAGARDIGSFNRVFKEKPKLKKEGFEVMPYIILIIDELADLMAAKGREVEHSIVRLSQLSRAVGIHLIVATQRPSVEVITGLIKANITSRVAFQVASQVDSRTILDTAGAEKLLSNGDMLFISSEFSRPRRIQGSYVTTPEIKRVVSFIQKENLPEEKEDVEMSLEKELEEEKKGELVGFSGEDSLYEEARKVIMEYRKASASLLQRRLRIGYARAARILDILEERGVVGPADGAKPREVYLKENPNDKSSTDPHSQMSNDQEDSDEEADSDWQKI